MPVDVKRIYEVPSPQDGQRILVDRLWPRGVSKEKAALSLWLKEIAPSNELRKWYHQDMSQRAEFERRYRAELEANPAPVAELQKLIGEGRVTLLYSAQDLENNHARVLVRYMNERK